MSEDLLKTVKHLIASGKGDTKRLREIIDTIKQGHPVVMSDYRYIQSLTSEEAKPQGEERETEAPIPPKAGKTNEALELLRIRLAEGKITVDEFRELKKALVED